MASPRNVAFVVAIVGALGAGAYYVATRGSSSDGSATATAADRTVAATAKTSDPATTAATPAPIAIQQRAPDRPALAGETPLPSLANGSAAQTPSEVFSVEPRDAAWATPMEGEIKDRLAKAPVNVVADCRQTRCQIQLDGDSDSVSQTIAIMESHQGMIGFAENLYLTAPEVHTDGTMTLKAIASFAR